MKSLNSSLPAKVTAVFLLVLTALVTAGAAVAVLYMYQAGYYGDGLVAPDSWVRYNFIYRNRYGLIGVLVAGLILFLVLLVFLLCAAGHRRGLPGITLNGQDKIPYDLYLAGSGTAAGLLIYGAGSLFYEELFHIIVAVVCLTGAFMLGLAILLTTAARLKAGGWWRNTVIYRLLGLLRRGAGRLGDALGLAPLVWRTGLVFCAAVVVDFFLAMWFFGEGDPMPFLMGVGFNGFLLVLLCRISLELQTLRTAGERLAAGDVEYKTDTRKMLRELRRHGDNLNRAGEGMALAVDRQMKSERLKTELITNVSHDIKTPLTSIINYVDLLSRQELEGQSAEYLAVLDRQAKRLKKLTEDLVEASKASTGNLSVTLERTDVCELVRQAVGEYEERLEAGRLEVVIPPPEQATFVLADGRLLWRVMDNLLSNAVKYAQPDTRVYIDVTDREPGTVTVIVKNISRNRLNVDADELMERFVRGESSRTTEGSGLGLNIARSLVELQKGAFILYVDGDLFKAELKLRSAP